MMVFTSAITSGPMPSPGRSSSLWVAMIESLTFAGVRRAGQGKSRGLLKRPGGLGKMGPRRADFSPAGTFRISQVEPSLMRSSNVIVS